MTPLNCASCGHANRDSARFCAVCGDGLVPSCSFCGAAVEAGAQFCDACGAPVAGAREPPSGARRVVSVVFADLAGSTELQESLDAESVRRVMERFYEAMRSVVQSHGGQVAKFIGDAVVAVFGARGVGEHDALRAVRAAAAMVSDLAELGDEFERGWGVRLAMRTGVNTGELVVGEDQEILVGDTMNTAARLELGGGLAALGDRAPERWWARYARLFAARELDPALALFAAEGCEFLDRRRFGWETGGQERAAAHLRTSWAGSTDIRVEVEEVLACDERVIALRLNWQGTTSKATGGGRFVLPVGAVSVIESGRAVRWEQFESEDREAMLARYAELGGGQRSLGELPPERYCTEVVRRFAARDLQALLELHAEDWTLVDHRALGWEEMRGLDGYREGMRSLFSMSPDIRVEIDDVLACDERVIATRLGYRGIGRQAGEFEFLIGNVTVVEGGRGVSVELYDYDDDAAMLARYAELGGRPEETDTATARL